MGFFDFLSSTRITSNEAKSLIKSGAQLIDVRTREEFAGGHISSAKNIPVQELASRLSELPNRTRKLVVYCRSGGRSATAASLLKQAGYEVFDLGAMTNYEA